jgi:MFS transporter, putative metabolite:H+ symporter
MAQAFTPYQRRLFVFLSVATFFEGFDFIALTQILPNLRKDLGLDVEWSGYLVAFINLGTVFAYALVRYADRWGRRRVLTVTIAGYTLFSFLSGLSPNVFAFAVLQLLARIFLIAEWATSNVVAAEEFPAERRGMVIGVIGAFSALGGILCAGLGPMLLATQYGWRSVYFVGIIPLVLLAYARRNLRETQRFSEQLLEREKLAARSKVAVYRAEPPEQRSFMYVWRTPYRGRILKLGLIWFTTYGCTQNAVAFWKEFAVGERGFSDQQVGTAVVVAALVSLPMVFFAGKLCDLVGRRPAAALIFGSGACGIWGAYNLHGFWPLTVALIFAIFCASGVLAVLSTFNTELFPTDIRADAFAWSNNLIGRISYVSSPLAVGLAAKQWGWGIAVGSTAVLLVVAVALIFLLLPETRGRELEETAAA